MKKTPLSLNVNGMAKNIVNNLNGNTPNKAKSTPKTKNFDKMKDDKGSVSGKDKITTLTHLLDSVDFNMNHGYNHVMEAKVHTEKAVAHMRQNPQMEKAYSSLHDRIIKVNNKLKRFQPKD